MDNKSGILVENEKQANKIVAKVMRITFLMFTLGYFLNVIGIFVVDDKIMTIAYIGGGILLLLPTLLINILKKQSSIIKYINIMCSATFVMLLCTTLTYHVVVIYVYPIAIASLYFSKKLSIAATALTVVGVSVGQYLAFQLDTLADDNFLELYKLVLFGIVPRALILIAVAAIFIMLSGRTAALLSNLLGAEAQTEMFENMQRMRDSVVHTSANLNQMMESLAAITETSLKANQQISIESEHLSESSLENTNAVNQMDKQIQDISEELEGLNHLNHKTAALTIQIEKNTQENQEKMEHATDSMEQIYKSTNDCKRIITQLGEESKEILGIVQAITGISSKTNILALNASIEAARAGEQGKGFAVVADEIQKLAEQTKEAVENIGVIVYQVADNTEKAVMAMEQNASFTQAGMEDIHKANESAVLIADSNKELSKQIASIDKAAEIIKEKNEEVVDNMRQISDNTRSNYDAVEQVSAVTKENSKAADTLASVVEQIKDLSEQLDRVIHE